MMVGIERLSVYVPQYALRATELAAARGIPPEPLTEGLGVREMAIAAPCEDVVTLAATAGGRLLRAADLDPSWIGLLIVATETGVDHAKPVGIFVHELLGIGRRCRVYELKHACYAGTAALMTAADWVRASVGRRRKALVIASDIARYELRTPGEPTQGAGAVALLIERHPKLFGVDLAHAGSASDYRGPDFRKPFARHFTEGYAPNTRRLSDFPVFSGKYSTFSYLDETVHAVEDMLRKLNVSAGRYYDSVHSLFFHRPYQMMPVQAMSFLYVRGLARGDHHHDELRALCQEAGVSFDDVLKETASTPDLYGDLLKDDAVADPNAATTAAAVVAA